MALCYDILVSILNLQYIRQGDFMKKVLCLITAVFLGFSSFVCYADMTKDDVTNHFNDVLSNKVISFSDISPYPWAQEAITSLANLGIVNGVGDGLFMPQNTVSRFEFIKMITGVCGIVNQNAAAPYVDLDKTHWAYIHVSSAYEMGLLDIYSGKILNGAAPITREEIAYISVKAMLKSEIIEKQEANSPLFSDTDKMSDFSPNAIATLASLNIINGRDDGSFGPKDFATRAESAKIVYNVLNIAENNF